MLCEIRVPTYRRPALLRRALESVRAQTHTDWRCIVFDDCPEGSARGLVEEINDSRLQWRRNEPPRGAIGNIDQAFRNRPYASGQFACVLEDDNYLLPQHLAAQLHATAQHRVSVTFTSQWCEKVVAAGAPGVLTNDRTLAWIYPEGRYRWHDLLPAVLFSHGFSNGAVFWKLGHASDFEIGTVTQRPGIQETLRLLRLRDDCFISHAPSAVWRGNDPVDSYVSRETVGLRKRIDRLRELREIQDYRRWYLAAFGCDAAGAFAKRFPQHAERIARSMILCGYPDLGNHFSQARHAALRLQGLAFRLVVPRQLDLAGLCETTPSVPAVVDAA